MAYHSRRGLASLAPSDESIIATGRRITERVGERLHERVTEHTPVAEAPPEVSAATFIRERGGRVPGELKRSWKIGTVTVSDGGRAISVDVYTEDPVAPHVEWDTAPHLILPRKPGGALRYRDRLGNVVFAKVVNHPGTRGVHMMATASVEVAATWYEIGEEEVARWAAEQQAL